MISVVFCLQFFFVPLPLVPFPSLVCRTWFSPLHLPFRLQKIYLLTLSVLISASPPFPPSTLGHLVTSSLSKGPAQPIHNSALHWYLLSYAPPQGQEKYKHPLPTASTHALTQPSLIPAFQHPRASTRWCTDWFVHCPHPCWTLFKVAEICVYQYGPSYSEALGFWD